MYFSGHEKLFQHIVEESDSKNYCFKCVVCVDCHSAPTSDMINHCLQVFHPSNAAPVMREDPEIPGLKSLCLPTRDDGTVGAAGGDSVAVQGTVKTSVSFADHRPFYRCDWGKTNLFWKVVCSYTLALERKWPSSHNWYKQGKQPCPAMPISDPLITPRPHNCYFGTAGSVLGWILVRVCAWLRPDTAPALCLCLQQELWSKDCFGARTEIVLFSRRIWTSCWQNPSLLHTELLLAATSPPQMSLPFVTWLKLFCFLVQLVQLPGARLPSPHIPSDTSAGGFISWGTFPRFQGLMSSPAGWLLLFVLMEEHKFPHFCCGITYTGNGETGIDSRWSQTQTLWVARGTCSSSKHLYSPYSTYFGQWPKISWHRQLSISCTKCLLCVQLIKFIFNCFSIYISL